MPSRRPPDDPTLAGLWAYPCCPDQRDVGLGKLVRQTAFPETLRRAVKLAQLSVHDGGAGKAVLERGRASVSWTDMGRAA